MTSSRSAGPRARKPRGRSRVGERFVADVGPVAHGGFCVTRLPEEGNRVVFVRHALPGERVEVQVTDIVPKLGTHVFACAGALEVNVRFFHRFRAA